MKKILSGQKTIEIYKDCDISGIDFIGYLVTTALCSSLGVDYSYINVKMVLDQDGRENTIYNGELLPLLIAQGFEKSAFYAVNQLTATRPNGRILTHATLAHLTNAKIDFGTVLNLRGNSNLKVEVDAKVGVFGATVTAASSYIMMDGIQAIGKQTEIPIYQVHGIPASVANFDVSIGDNCVKAVFVNTDEISITSAAAVLKSISIQSDRYNVDLDYSNLLVQRLHQFENLEEANARMQSFNLLPAEVDRLRIRLNLESASVDAGKNFIVTHSWVTNASIMNRYERRNQKHYANAYKKLK
ncbi:MAG: hypothetical protein K9J13_13850 [Saprospiraceae bacterium]|nr:hypothetical protein [Saprospiraceae bacterium]